MKRKENKRNILKPLNLAISLHLLKLLSNVFGTNTFNFMDLCREGKFCVSCSHTKLHLFFFYVREEKVEECEEQQMTEEPHSYLTFGGRYLRDDLTLADYGITEGSTLTILGLFVFIFICLFLWKKSFENKKKTHTLIFCRDSFGRILDS